MLTPEEGRVLSEELVYIIRISKRITKVCEFLFFLVLLYVKSLFQTKIAILTLSS